jgi:uncharacterized protein (TIGR02145 family)
MQISILHGSANGTAVYTETQTPTTNANGLVTIEIGTGTTSNVFSTIDWSAGPYYIKTETDPASGTNYTITGTSQLLSVPYALHSKTAETFTETDPSFSASQAANITASDITHLSNLSGTNTGDQDISSFISSETDPVYAASQASNITSGDITNLSNLSGVNTGDQTLALVLESGNNAGNQRIINLGYPEDPKNAATKAYVDDIRDLIYEDILDAGYNGIVKDIVGNIYKTIKIGDQVWMAENLKVLKYNDGSLIPYEVAGNDWEYCGNHEMPAWCFYGNNSENFKDYGVLYNWHVVNTGNLCPTGWHVPTDAEWTILTDYLENNGYGYGGSGADIAKSMASTYDWDVSAIAGLVGNAQEDNNSSGLALPPGARRDANGTYDYLGARSYTWSASQVNSTEAFARRLTYNLATVTRSDYDKGFGCSVRCIRD